MRIIHKNESNLFENSADCKVSEYALSDEEVSGAVVKVRGRYPESGYAMNNACKELAYILEGQGKIDMSGRKEDFVVGDMMLIDRGEKYFWEGDFSALLCSVPAWKADQYEITD